MSKGSIGVFTLKNDKLSRIYSTGNQQIVPGNKRKRRRDQRRSGLIIDPERRGATCVSARRSLDNSKVIAGAAIRAVARRLSVHLPEGTGEPEHHPHTASNRSGKA
ncbi:hypothetical protein SKAU_G00379530 [Synaphobranchus kaupii]|uniref:Uncharacterized protein n=1 Tax=Synaphobranchus kaupii TaxID=118154 RepID=A0A9Q1ICI1_SYNKA|nr:hypothetical protein SKAU_G00379530 [Synaphobranchus kaupii]